MRASLRIKTTVLPGHRIEFSSPELNDGEAVDVLIEHSTPKSAGAPLNIAARMLLNLPLDERRKILTQQAELLQEEYGSDPEREAWQGGDIVAE